MKKVIIIAGIAALLFSCASTSEPASRTVPADQTTASFEVLQHRGTVLGTNTPEWVIQSIELTASQLEALPQYEGKYVFVAEQSGGNLNAVQTWAQSVNVAGEFARRVSTRVEQQTSAALAGDLDDAATYIEQVTNTLSAATFAGMSQEGEWWVQLQWLPEGNQEFRYFILMTIDKETLDRQIADSIDGIRGEDELNDNEARVRDLVKGGL
ncbi:hypothetical protein [Spirochaeta dissipatitropha]